ncbi:THUMP-like domain-containing protein [Dermacoccaceae bacterium W4C1]
MDPAVLERLTSGEGWGLLQSLPPYRDADAFALTSRLRSAGFDPELVSAALTQARLRAAAVDKVGTDAAEMLFTPDGLEQATRKVVADEHARRFAEAGVQRVHDLGCGIGVDAMAFARAGMAVQAVDADEVTAKIAATNLRPWSRADAQQGRAEDVALPRGEAGRSDGLWLDPARRVPGVADITGRTKRIFDLEQISPSWTQVRSWAGSIPAAGAKLSPAFPHGQVPVDAEACWTSFAGDVVECTLWWGSLVRHRGRTAQVVRGEDSWLVTQEMAADGDDAGFAAATPAAGTWLYEPDRAVLRAGLVGALCAAVSGHELAPGVGYVASSQERHLPWARRMLITEAMPFNVKRLRALLRDRGVGPLTIKKRGVTLDADQLRRQLRLHGDTEATIVITRVGAVQVALLVTAG